MTEDRDQEAPVVPEAYGLEGRMDRLEERLHQFLAGSDDENVEQPDPTRTSVIKTHRSGETVEMEWNSIHSVEITQTVKEGWRVSKVKVYDPDPLAAARLGAKLAMEAESELERAMNAKHAAITERADAAESEESDG